MRHAEQRGNKRVASALLRHPLAGVNQNKCDVCGGGSSDHVAGVLNVARGVRDDELAAWRGEVAIRHINGDPLLAFRTEAVGQEREVGVLVPALTADALHRFKLIGEERL